MNRYITTPLYYVNSRAHLGHAYTTLLADILKKNYAQRGDSVHFLTGTDEHGQKIAQSAGKLGQEPKAFVDSMVNEWKALWESLQIDYDQFYRTTDPSHVRAVQHALKFVKDKGEIEFREYEGAYCVGCERFLTDQEVTPEGVCPDHQTKPERRREANYFFLMSRYQERLIKHIETHPEFIRPEQYRNEVLSFLKQPLEDLCISRPKDRLTWGIELPFDSKFVTYVWFDALLNYLAGTGWPDSKAFDQERWESAIHLVGKDIIKQHGIYWPTMLMALDVPLFHGLEVNGFLLIGGNKMSKSVGSVADPGELAARFGVEVLRFYAAREVVYGMDATYTIESLIQCNNAYLANGFGNLTARVLTLAVKAFGTNKKIESPFNDAGALAKTLSNKRCELQKTWDDSFRDLKYQNALKAWSDLVTETDIYINEMKPWALAKDPSKKAELEMVLLNCVRVLQTLAVVIYPVLPRASLELLRAIGLPVTRKEGPEVSWAIDDARVLSLAAEVPKLFARHQLDPVKPE